MEEKSDANLLSSNHVWSVKDPLSIHISSLLLTCHWSSTGNRWAKAWLNAWMPDSSDWKEFSVRITKCGHHARKQMNADVVFHFTGCLCLPDSSLWRGGGLFFHVFNGWERPQPLFVAEAFSNTNDQQSHTNTQAELVTPWLQNSGSMPAV